MANKTIKTIDQFRKTYFPKEYERQKLSEMSSTELGEDLAKKFIIKIRKKYGKEIKCSSLKVTTT